MRILQQSFQLGVDRGFFFIVEPRMTARSRVNRHLILPFLRLNQGLYNVKLRPRPSLRRFHKSLKNRHLKPKFTCKKRPFSARTLPIRCPTAYKAFWLEG